MNRPEPLASLSPQQRAERASEVMWPADRAPQWLGVTLDAVAPGRAEMSLTVEPHHANAHGTCHGGVIFTLADSAFAYASNSRNERTVAAQNAITFLAPARLGDRLRAVAVEVARVGRSSVCDVTVSNQHGAVLALLRGTARSVGGAHFEETDNG